MAHRQKKIEYQRKYHQDNKGKISNKRRTPIDQLKITHRNLGINQQTDKAGYNKKYHLEAKAGELLVKKIKAMQIVSGQKIPTCCNCGEGDIHVLAINHIKGGGRKEFKEMSYKAFRESILTGARITDDLDVRCHNCNIRYEYERGQRRLPNNWQELYNKAVK